MSDNPYKPRHVARDGFLQTGMDWLLPRIIVGYVVHAIFFAAYLYMHTHHSALSLRPCVREVIDMLGIWGYAVVACTCATVPLTCIVAVGCCVQRLLKEKCILERQFWFDVFVGASVALDIVLGRLAL